jgi:soluble lytic murein transglycosylase
MKKVFRVILIISLLSVILFFSIFFALRSAFPRPFRKTVKTCGMNPNLVYSVIKTESGFNSSAVSKAGAIGMMQLLPSTAEFVCETFGIEYQFEKLSDGEYNILLGCKYLLYLAARFPVTETALCAYNAGEGTVSEWLRDPALSKDGVTLERIPYPETREYIKKIKKFMKIYEFLY